MKYHLILVLLAVTIGTGQMSACPRGHCAMARTMACCQHSGLTQPSCCPPLRQVRARASSTAADPVHGPRAVMAVLSWTVPTVPSRWHLALPELIQRSSAPPGTLLSQRTSLVLWVDPHSADRVIHRRSL